ncbi:unnamed protein product [Vitrella brassicaformis CCMP3155]|uniref:TLDc domain-containing protein n=1 Tax=Vitrella brassicaformis (strain CCMP3155) TaxID=1169540 RepID=A0A0G4GZ56_VITBC|nr:unnamed protein product [Vitrella brassicaformis CCMP3155]|eukprot:CEM36482.1 unnamed protein product [Vitrella brassicaformis CCMP3155]
MGIGGGILLGWSGTSDGPPSADIRNCYQYTPQVREGYMGVMDEEGDAALGGALEFIAEEIEVLEVPHLFVPPPPVPTLPPPSGTPLSASEYEALVYLLGGDTTRLTSLYRMSVDGTTYGDLLDNVGDAKPLILVIKKDQYVFGVYVSAGIQEPDDPTSDHEYRSDIWWFSLAGHFDEPTKIEIPQENQGVTVAGRKWNAFGANMGIGGGILLGWSGTSDGPPSADIRSCYQYTRSEYVPEGYMGVMDEEGDALLGGSQNFIVNEIEVLSVLQ